MMTDVHVYVLCHRRICAIGRPLVGATVDGWRHVIDIGPRPTESRWSLLIDIRTAVARSAQLKLIANAIGRR